MYNAPSVSYPVGRCAFQRKVYVLLTCVTSALLIVWAFLQPIGLVWLLAALSACMAIVLGGRSCFRDEGVLTWDGQVWCLHHQPAYLSDALGHVNVSLDVQHALVLQWQPLSNATQLSTRWLWLGAENAPNFWQDLRCAVFARSNAL
jgi:hypothetical protein